MCIRDRSDIYNDGTGFAAANNILGDASGCLDATCTGNGNVQAGVGQMCIRDRP